MNTDLPPVQEVRYFNPGGILVGLMVPSVTVVGSVAFLGRSNILVAGIPVVYFWVFLWFVLTLERQSRTRGP